MRIALFLILLAGCGSGVYDITREPGPAHGIDIGTLLFGLGEGANAGVVENFACENAATVTPDNNCIHNNNIIFTQFGDDFYYCTEILLLAGDQAFAGGQWRNAFGFPVEKQSVIEAWCAIFN
jgi:hypothetical protein